MHSKTIAVAINSALKSSFRYLSRLAGSRRDRIANRHLAGLLAFVAGAVNAGGFLAVNRYTSHVTGVVSAMADDFAAGSFSLVFVGAALLGAFISGAAYTAVWVNWARRRKLHSLYAIPLLFEAALLLLFGVAGASVNSSSLALLPATALLLCFVMGLQNAVVTKMSGAELRTTHMTGIATDIGVELGRLFYWNRTAAYNEVHPVRANRDKLMLHFTVLTLFLVGGVVGALAFRAMGFAATVPLAVALAVVAGPVLLDDLRKRRAGEQFSDVV